jgi:hypothetical protein
MRACLHFADQHSSECEDLPQTRSAQKGARAGGSIPVEKKGRMEWEVVGCLLGDNVQLDVYYEWDRKVRVLER